MTHFGWWLIKSRVCSIQVASWSRIFVCQINVAVLWMQPGWLVVLSFLCYRLCLKACASSWRTQTRYVGQAISFVVSSSLWLSSYSSKFCLRAFLTDWRAALLVVWEDVVLLEGSRARLIQMTMIVGFKLLHLEQLSRHLSFGNWIALSGLWFALFFWYLLPMMSV